MVNKNNLAVFLIQLSFCIKPFAVVVFFQELIKISSMDFIFMVHNNTCKDAQNNGQPLSHLSYSLKKIVKIQKCSNRLRFR
jgi:hypothetical protein